MQQQQRQQRKKTKNIEGQHGRAGIWKVPYNKSFPTTGQTGSCMWLLASSAATPVVRLHIRHTLDWILSQDLGPLFVARRRRDGLPHMEDTERTTTLTCTFVFAHFFYDRYHTPPYHKQQDPSRTTSTYLIQVAELLI